jgi:eukaryotic-like serine/threonine-protein kinase
MSLSAGTRLGPYEVTAPIGAGGMGEVYRAHDSRLNRDVAIKTLPDAFAQDSNRLARFQREAQLLASLNHPNIAGIYGVEESQGTRALVMELVEGPTLAERIAAGPIALPEVLSIAHQIADALEAAHEKGIIHRDLKPANIKLTPEGKVKVLDFGLARALEGDPTNSNPANSPTLTLESTRAGMILGTAAYMSPEQARGKVVDKRADIWAFGVVLYEMLSGRITFEGETVSDTLAAVLRADIDWSHLPADTPPKVRRLLQRCLERDPKRRLRDIGDAWIEMETPDEPPVASAKLPPKLQWLPWLAAALIGGAGIVWGLLHTPPVQPHPVVRWTYSQKDLFAFVTLSRDGTRLVYSELTGTVTRLSLRMMDQFGARPIPGADGGTLSAFSPDGQWIAYLAGLTDQKLRKIPVTGGTSITLADGVSHFGLSWGDDDTIVFSGAKGLMRVPASGGTPETITTLDAKKGETGHRWPRFLPGAHALLFTVATEASSQIAVLDLEKHSYHVLASNGSDPSYVPTGHLVYVRGGTLFAVPFDVRRLAVTGSEAPVIEGVSSLGSPDIGDYTFSGSGLLVYLAGKQAGKTLLAWADRKGVVQPVSEPQSWGTGRLSPDGRRVANEIQTSVGGAGDIWIYELERKTLTRLTFEGSNEFPIWTPDGRRVTFRSMVSGKHGISWVPSDGSGRAELLVATDTTATPSSWTPDGKFLVYSQPGPNKNNQLWVLPAPGSEGAGKPHLLHDAPFSEGGAQISPDGRWVAYVSSESGASEVYLQPFPAPGGKMRMSTQGGRAPRWSHDGRELFYWSGQGTAELMSVEIQTAPTFRAGLPQSLFHLAAGTTWDVAPDAKRFLVELVPGAEEGGRRLEAVDNWFDELRLRAPAKH